MIGRDKTWKLVSTITGALCALLAQKLMGAAYRASRKENDPASPFDPTSARFSWAEALVWAAAAGIGLGVTKVVSARLAALGWKAATGTRPPGVAGEPAPV
jgi:Protein of unknown function (DUF4235)